MNVAYLSIGSNIGDRLHHLTEAVRALHSHDGINSYFGIIDLRNGARWLYGSSGFSQYGGMCGNSVSGTGTSGSVSKN